MPTFEQKANDVKYFWYWRPKDGFPPQPIVCPEELSGAERLNIA